MSDENQKNRPHPALVPGTSGRPCMVPGLCLTRYPGQRVYVGSGADAEAVEVEWCARRACGLVISRPGGADRRAAALRPGGRLRLACGVEVVLNWACPSKASLRFVGPRAVAVMREELLSKEHTKE